MSTSLLNTVKQIETLQSEALESCSDSAKKVLLEIAIEKTQALTEIINKPSCHTPTTETIGARIQLARENLGLTEADLARQLNTYSDHISDWECGITEGYVRGPRWQKSRILYILLYKRVSARRLP